MLDMFTLSALHDMPVLKSDRAVLGWFSFFGSIKAIPTRVISKGVDITKRYSIWSRNTP
jgi:hypothetical protein